MVASMASALARNFLGSTPMVQNDHRDVSDH